MRRLLATALLLAAAGCVRQPDPFEYTEPALSIHAVIRAGETGAAVSILRSLERGSAGTSGAEVTLASGGSTAVLPEASGSGPGGCYSPYFSDPLQGCYAGTLPRAVAPGSRWTLTAELPTGETATGSTVVPAPPAVLSPAAGQRVFFTRYRGGTPEPAELEIEWQTAAAPRVEIRLGEGTAFRDGARVEGSRCMVGHRQIDAAVGRPSGRRLAHVDDVYCYEGPGGEMEWDSASVPLLVTAFDSAYADFALHGSSVSRSHRGASLKGAYGVFGSAATTRRDIVLIPRRD